MRRSETLREEAARLGIHRNTAFRWRHRVLGDLLAGEATLLRGLVALTELTFPFSEKGARRLRRAARRRAWPLGWRSLSAPAVWVIVAKEPAGGVASVVSGRRRPGWGDYARLLSRRLESDARLSASRAIGARIETFARKSGRTLLPVRSGLDAAADAVGYARALRGWIRRFRGVATRYLDHYLTWHRWLGLRAEPLFADMQPNR